MTGQVYHHDFSEWKDVVREYFNCGYSEEKLAEALRKHPEPEEVIYAGYVYEDYNGDSTVVYREGNDYFLVSGSHCSCFGLENQWDPERYAHPELLEIAWRTYESCMTLGYTYKQTMFGAAVAILKREGIKDLKAALRLHQQGFSIQQILEQESEPKRVFVRSRF